MQNRHGTYELYLSCNASTPDDLKITMHGMVLKYMELSLYKPAFHNCDLCT